MPVRNAKEETTCDLCGETVFLPPGIVFRGIVGHKQCIARHMKETYSNEVTGPEVAAVESRLERVLDVPQ